MVAGDFAPEIENLIQNSKHSSQKLPEPPASNGDDAILPIGTLVPADSPRLAGEDTQHVRALADSCTELPPILVHGRTMRVIDGMHRLRAAQLRGEETIRARLFDGDDDAAFVIAVEANVAHGLPLSLADREAAAARIVVSHPQWSDRAIAVVSGLSAKTVGAIRQDAAGHLPAPDSRIGRDGRVRPLNSVDGRRRASELIARHPEASSREVARFAGISPSTVRDVRARMRRGEDPVPARQRNNGGSRPPATPEQRIRSNVIGQRVNPAENRDTILSNLRRDPSVKHTESGRRLLRWLDVRANGLSGWQSIAGSVPPHCAYAIADLACTFAEEWLDVASDMRQRADSPPEPEGNGS